MSQNQGNILERIAAALREAESLREEIRAKKESSADTSLPAMTTLMGAELRSANGRALQANGAMVATLVHIHPCTL
ncbi:hypothetical protein BDZ89DRAFT_1173838 [Hymenopellis radicata]|nr:hypothetical protein BDZ89DRAFT_1173838 [Hymenopellis radicata]